MVTFFWNASSTSSSNASACWAAEPFIGAMRELLGLEADASVKLHLEPLAGIRLIDWLLMPLYWSSDQEFLSLSSSKP